MEVIDKKVLIKEARAGQPDKVYIVRNLPKSVLFDENGKLLNGIQKSATNDGALVFAHWDREGKERLDILDRYIDSVWPRTKQLPKRIPNQQVEGLMTSPPLPVTELEGRLKSLYGVPYLDLPIPDEKDVPSFQTITTSEAVTKTYKTDDFYDIDEKPKAKEVKKEGPNPLKCVGCEFVGKNSTALRMHIMKKHKVKEEVKEVATISNP